jgi:hypothetical protein
MSKNQIGKALSILGIIAMLPALFVVALSSMTDGALQVKLEVGQLFNTFIVIGIIGFIAFIIGNTMKSG